MPKQMIRGVNLVYEILGGGGPWVVISPGGRRGLSSDRALGALLAEAGYRALVYDRRNTGASDIGFPGTSESHEQAEDLLALLQALGTGPVYVAGCSSGSRLSLLLALHHREVVKALLLWRVTGGPYAAKKLAFNYYEQFIAAAEKGGIDAVAQTEHFAAMIAANPRNRKILDELGAESFLAAMRRWLAGFNQGSGHPVAGLSPDEMRGISLPTIIVPGNDLIQPRAPGQAAHRLMPNSEYREVMTEDVNVDVDFAAWEKKNGTLAGYFIDFLRRQEKAR